MPTQAELEQREKVAQQLVKRIKKVSWFDSRIYWMELFSGNVVPFPSSTTILNAAPKPWLARYRGDVGNEEADEILAEAGERGGRVHHACYTYATGGGVCFKYPKHQNPDPEVNEEADMAIAQWKALGVPYTILHDQWEYLYFWRFKQWIDIVNPRILAGEMICFNMEHKYAGTLDFLMEIQPGEYPVMGEKLWRVERQSVGVLDLKTSHYTDQAQLLQLGSYAKCILSYPIDFTILLHLRAKTEKGIAGVQTIVRSPGQFEEDFTHFLYTKALWHRFNMPTLPVVFDMPAASMRTGYTPTEFQMGLTFGDQNEQAKVVPLTGPTLELARAAVTQEKDTRKQAREEAKKK